MPTELTEELAEETVATVIERKMDRYLVGRFDEFLRWEVKDIGQRQAMKGVIEP